MKKFPFSVKSPLLTRQLNIVMPEFPCRASRGSVLSGFAPEDCGNDKLGNFVLGVILLLLLSFSCSPEKAAERKAADRAVTPPPAAVAGVDSAGRYSLEVIPATADRNATLTAIPRGFRSPGDDIEWLVNDGLSAKGQTFRTKDVLRGDLVKAKAVVNGKEVMSNVIQIKNTPPELTKVKLMPEVFKPGDEMYVDAEAKDDDGDSATVLYEWTKNGQPAGDGKVIEGQVKRGDKISVKVTPFDGEEKGRPITVATEVRNMPPAIEAHNNFNFDGKVWTYQVKASDADGDPLAYSLSVAPQGMTIDPGTGRVTWIVPEEFRGKTSFTVVVKDGQGGEASYTAKVSITEEKD
jgi:hypothetical protein